MIYFLQHADDLDRVPENADTLALQEAYEVAAQHTWTAEELDIYEAQEFKIAINQNVIETALMDGIEQGITQGITQGEHQKALAIAKKLLVKGLDVETIAEATCLTIEAVAQLRNSD